MEIWLYVSCIAIGILAIVLVLIGKFIERKDDSNDDSKGGK